MTSVYLSQYLLIHRMFVKHYLYSKIYFSKKKIETDGTLEHPGNNHIFLIITFEEETN